MSFASRVFRFSMFAAVSVCALVGSSSLALADADDDRLEQFLTRLGLNDLQTIHLEERLEDDLPNDQRRALAQRLADTYAGQLITHADKPDRYADVLRRIDRLVAAVPEAKTPALEVMLLQADYHRAEKLIGTWIADQSKAEKRRDAEGILSVIAPKLDDYYTKLTKKGEDLFAKLDDEEDKDRREALEKELGRTESVGGRAGYFAAWSSYYLGLARDEADKKSMNRARELFRKLLSISEDYAEVEPEFLSLESIWRSRSLIGLGLAEAALGNLGASRACFDLLQHVSVPREIKDQANYWRFQALVNAGRYDLAYEFAEQQIMSFTGSPTQGRVSFCVAVIRSAFGTAAIPGNDKTRMGMLGIAGLLKMRQRSIVRQMIEQYGIDVDETSGFYLQWIRGQQLLEKAEKAKDKAGYDAASLVFKTALDAPEARTDLGSAGQCQSQLAYCYYRLERFEEAARLYEQAETALKAAGDRNDAADALWMAFVAYQKLTSSETRFVSSAIAVLERIKRDYPSNKRAKSADYYISKLKRNAATPEETLANLNKVPRNSPNYLPARYDICTLLHEQWKNAKGGAKIDATKELVGAVDQYLQAARSSPDNTRKVKCCMLAVDACLNSDPADLSNAAQYLEVARPLASTLPAGNSTAAEFNYRALQLAKATGDSAAQRRYSDWLVKNGQGSGYELSALITAAKEIDKAIKSAGEGATASQIGQAHDIYSRLAALLGDSPDVIASKKNARVALSKAADYAYRRGYFAESAERMDKLLAATASEATKNKSYVRRAGLAHFNAGAFASALPHWRTLLSGLKKGSEEWYEAKYYQLACLSNTDKDRFSQSLKQFRLLYPNVPAPWGTKLNALR